MNDVWPTWEVCDGTEVLTENGCTIRYVTCEWIAVHSCLTSEQHEQCEEALAFRRQLSRLLYGDWN